jgi:hypothetical protein
MAIPLSAYTDYRFSHGTIDDLMEVAYMERRATNHITCKCCGRRMMTTQYSLETLYTCSKSCYKQIAQILTESPQRAAARAAN